LKAQSKCNTKLHPHEARAELIKRGLYEATSPNTVASRPFRLELGDQASVQPTTTMAVIKTAEIAARKLPIPAA
jgi:hypothetical protein